MDECLQSFVHQSRRPDEVIVVDDASEDDTAELAACWADWGERCLRIDHRNVRLARLAGLEATSSEIVCFLDADDRLTPDYLRSGLAAFDRHDIGFVYSDADWFDENDSLIARPETIDVASMSRTNHVHNGALVRREALEMSSALEVPVDPQVTHEDWLVWRRILEQGWQAKKQRTIYGYRSHQQSVSRLKQVEQSYFELRGLTHETITLFVALSGRMALWPRMKEFLERQGWPHNQTRLLLMDTSQNDEFGRQVRHWLAECDYLDVRYLAKSVGNPGLADQNRHQRDVQDHVRLAAARIYNRMAREVTGNFVCILEDDVIPPLDAAEKLLRGFDGETVSVAGPYPSRFHEGYVAWTEGRQIIKSMPKMGDKRSEHTASDRSNSSFSSLRSPAYSRIEGNGFGCVMLRTEVLTDAVFTCRQPPHYDFDPAFYERIKDAGNVKVCWDVECEHLEQEIGSNACFD